MDKSEFMTTTEAAELLGIAQASVSRLVREGRLEGERFGPVWMVKRQSVEDYKERFADLPKHSPRRKKKAAK